MNTFKTIVFNAQNDKNLCCLKTQDKIEPIDITNNMNNTENTKK